MSKAIYIKEMENKYGIYTNGEGKSEFPLTIQQYDYIQMRLESDAVMTLNAGVELIGDLDLRRMERAVNRFYNCVDSCRLRFVSKNNTFMQKVVAGYDYHLECILVKGNTSEEKLKNCKEAAIISFTKKVDVLEDDLFEVKFYKLAEQHYFMTVNAEHAIFDGASMVISLNKIFTYYNEDFSKDQWKNESMLVEYAMYLDCLRNSEIGQKQIEYWDEYLKDYQDIPFSPASKKGILLKEPYKVVKPREEFEKFARNNRTSMVNIGVLAMHMALSKRFGVEDTAFSISSANRSHKEYSETIGTLVRALAHRIIINDDSSCAQLLKRSMRITSEIIKNQDLCGRNITRTALSIHNYGQNICSIPNITMIPWIPEYNRNYDLMTFEYWESTECVSFFIQCNPDTFDLEEIKKISEYMQEAIDYIMADPTKPALNFVKQATNEVKKENYYDFMKKIWMDELGTDEIGEDESFFDLGGNSLVASKIVEAFNYKTGTELVIADIYEYETLRTLCDYAELCKNGN